MPAPIQRMRAQDLIAAVFPAQTGCQDNHGAGAIEIPDHPLVRETLRDCLTEAMDAAGLRRVLTDMRAGKIETLARDVPEPSVFSHEILNANPYAFLDDAPLEERRTRAVAVRRGLPPEIVERLGGLDPERVAEVIAEAQPDPRNADELHDLLLDLGALPAGAGEARGWTGLLDELIGAARAARTDGEAPFWVAAERRVLVSTIWPARRFLPDVVAPPARRAPAWTEREGALTEVVRAHLALLGPTTAGALGGMLDLPPADVEAALARVEMEGNVLRGKFVPAPAGSEPLLQWCDRRLLARINRRMLDGLRKEIEPATAADYLRFLFSWQHVRGGTALHGRGGLLQVVAQLQGCEIAAGAWEREVLPARVAGYDSAWLDGLCLSGELAWGRLAPRETALAPSRAAPIAIVRRRDLPWLLTPGEADTAQNGDGAGDAGLSPPARDVLRYLREAGASFVDDIIQGAHRLRSEAEDALWELVSAGRVTGDGFAGLRALISATQSRGGARARWHARWTRRTGSPAGSGRWALLRSPQPPPEEEELHEALARQYIKRYGIVFRDVLAREPRAPPWRDLLRVYRRLEMRGELRGGRLVAGFVGEQFAAPEAVESMRAIRREPPRGEIVRISACDPLNLVGIITPGPRVPATLANQVVFRDGVPQAAEDAILVESGPLAQSAGRGLGRG